MATQTSASVSTGSIPTILEPYYTGTPAVGTPGTPGYIPATTGLMPKAQEIFSKDYDTMYGNAINAAGLGGAGRVADLSPTQVQLGTELKAMGTPSEFGQGQASMTSASNLYNELSGLTPQQIQAMGLQDLDMTAAKDVGIGPLTTYQMTGPADVAANQFSKQALDPFMSTYMDQVVEVQKQQAIRDAQRANLAQSLGSARSGTYGGSASALAGAENTRNLMDLLAKTQATGSQSAYEQAMKGFENQRAADLQAALANQQAGLTVGQQNLAAQLGVQDLGTKSGLQAALANQAAQQEAAKQNLLADQQRQQLESTQYLDAQKANQLAELEASKQRASVAAGLGSLGANQTSAGVARQAADIDRLKTLGAYGDLERAVSQQELDARYQDVLRKAGFSAEQIGNLSNILRGVPVSDVAKSETVTTPSPSFASQLAGTGLTGLSLYNMMK
jgi:hypothetical protein